MNNKKINDKIRSRALESARDAGLTDGTTHSEAYVSGFEMGWKARGKADMKIIVASDPFPKVEALDEQE